MCRDCTPGLLETHVDDYISNRRKESDGIEQEERDLIQFQSYAEESMSSPWISLDEPDLFGFLRRFSIDERPRVYERIRHFYEKLATRGIIVHPPFLTNNPTPLQIANGL